ncbi:MAG: alkaline phosphatase family protein [Actinomycetota bacterium]|nr:alkaline phosphatase family protein [Actinomycetota bacterium]
MTSPTACRAALLVVAALTLAGCSPSSTPAVPAGALPPRPSVSAGVSPTKVLVIVEENHTETSALQQMPYLAAFADAYGHTTAYQAVAHPSLPNYLALAGGSTFGVTDDNPPTSHPIAGDSIFDSALAAGRSAKTYAEAMPTPCAQQPSGRYAVKHNAWAYFADPPSRANCQRFDVPAGTTSTGALRTDVDAGSLPTVGELIPDLCHDAHDCSLGTADDWLRQWMPVLMGGPDYRSGQLAIVVTFDEDDNSGPNTVLTTVIAPQLNHVVSAVALTHYSLSRYFAELSQTRPLREAASAPSLRAAFGI